MDNVIRAILLQDVRVESDWISDSTIIPEGKQCFSSDKGNAYKVGDGKHTWSELSYNSAIASDVPSWAKASTKPTYTKSEIGLENVENKSSSTIRGEITKDNVTKALGYTPPTKDTTYSAFKGSTSSANGTTGLVPSPSTGDNTNKYLKADGTWAVPPNTTYSAMTGATTSADGKSGLVPTPTKGANTRFLRSDGTWVVPPNTTYGVASTSANGLMSSTDKSKLDGVAEGANKYTHPSYTAKSSGLYKITVDSTGHVSAVTAVTKADITGLGIPAQDTNTTYSAMTGATADADGKSGLVPVPTQGASNRYLRSDGTWVVPPNTTYNVATTSANGLMSSTDKSKLDGIATGANKYTHPSYTAKSSGLYKITVDATGHVSAVTAVTKADITGLGIPSSDTNTWRGVQNNLTSTATDQSLSAYQGKILNESKATMKTLTTENLNDVTTPGFYNAGGGNTVTNKPSGVEHFGLIVTHVASGNYYVQQIFNDTTSYRRYCSNGTWESWTQEKVTDTVYTHPSYTAKSSGLYKITVDATGHVSAVTAVTKADITGLGIPSTNTTYGAAGSSLGLVKTGGNVSIASGVITVTDDGHKHSNSSITSLDASKLTGTIDIARLPQGALERCVVVKDDTARFALTTEKIQVGDTVKVTDTGKMYFVVDDTKLSEEAGYEVYTAGSATSVPWSGVTDKPSEFTPEAHTHTISDISNISTASVASATKATQDSAGQQINTTYIKGLSVNGRVITYTKGDGTTGTITTQDNNTTYSAMTGATADADGKSGLVPVPAKGSANRYLRSDGTWVVPPNTTYNVATTSANGLMSSTDKSKLDGIASGANKYTHPSYTARTSGLYKITVDTTGHVSAVTAVAKADITELGIPAQDTTYSAMTGATTSANGKAGLVPAPASGANTRYLRSDGTWVTPPNTTYNVATTSANGLMSSTDKSKLDGIASGANKYTHPSYTAKTSGLYKITVDASGHVSAVTAVTKADITGLGIPSSNTDTKVTQTAVDPTYYSNWRTILWGASNNASEGFSPATVTDSAYSDKNLTYQPSTGTLKAKTFKGNLNESNIALSNKNYTNSHSVIDTALVDALGANRLAFGSNASITLENSADGGSTWTEYGGKTNYPNSIFGSDDTHYFLTGLSASTKNMFRVTIDTDQFSLFANLVKFAIRVETDGATGAYCTIDASLAKTPTTFVTFANKASLDGDKGWNIINIPQGILTYVYNQDQATHYGTIRFTFGYTGVVSGTDGSGLIIRNIKGYGDAWETPSYMAEFGRLYMAEDDQSARFPKDVIASGSMRAETFEGDATSASAVSILNKDEIRFARPNGTFSDPGQLWFAKSWEGGTKTSLITQYNFGDGNGALTNVAAKRFIGTADSATKATQDSSGNTITSTYIKSASVSGKTITFTRGDNKTFTITTQDTNTTYNVATTSANGLMSSTDKSKLDGIASGANKYTHPSYTAKTSGLYKITVDATGHVSAVSAVTKADITALGIPAQDTNTTYGVATTSANGLMSSTDKSKLDGIASGANKYTHPSYTARTSGLYKITVDATGHVSAVTAVAKADITALGIPGTDTNTTYGAMTGASTSADGKSGLVPVPTQGASNRYLRSDGTWAVPPDTNTTYNVATTTTNGLMSSTDKAKLDGIATGANKYTHPSYTAKSSGLYKITVDATGHVSAVSAVTKADITGLGIPSSDTNTWRPLGTTADTACAGNDSRLSNSRPASDVYSWAKEPSKPSYTKSEVGLGNVDNTADANKSVKYATSAGTASAITKSKNIYDAIYPVGIILPFANTTDPNNVFTGTTWTKVSAGKTLIGAGTYSDGTTSKTFAVGDTGGKYKVALASGNLPSHTHSMTLAVKREAITVGSGSTTGYIPATGTQTTSTYSNSGTTGSTGSGTAFEVLTPYQTVQFWQRTA